MENGASRFDSAEPQPIFYKDKKTIRVVEQVVRQKFCLSFVGC